MRGKPQYAAVASQADPQQLNIRQILASGAQNAPNAQIICADANLRYTYSELQARVMRFAAMLHQLGIRAGDIVAVMDWESHRYLEAYFAVPALGAVLQTVNVRLSPSQVAYCISGTGAKLVLYHHDFSTLVAEIRPDTPGVERWIPMANPQAKDEGFESLLAGAPETFEFSDLDENALATTFHTTGTTGNPKAVEFSHRQLVLHTLSVMAAMAAQPDGQAFRRGDVYMPLTPMFHVHAWGFPYIATLMGTKQVYPGRYDPARILRLKREEGVTFSHCVPTVLQMVLDHAEEDLSPWAMPIGGAAMSAALHERAAVAGITAFAGYGMSETCPVVGVARVMPHAEASPSADPWVREMRPVPLALVDLQDEDGKPVVRDGEQIGELVVTAPWLTRAYGNDVQAGEQLWAGGVLHTQDLASMLPDGTFVIRDRVKDVIKSGGEWISSVQLEDLITTHPAVREVAVVGVPDPHWTERPAAFVVLQKGATVDAASLRAHLQPSVERGELNRIAIPSLVTVVDALPRTSVGKIDKKALLL